MQKWSIVELWMAISCGILWFYKHSLSQCDEQRWKMLGFHCRLSEYTHLSFLFPLLLYFGSHSISTSISLLNTVDSQEELAPLPRMELSRNYSWQVIAGSLVPNRKNTLTFAEKKLWNHEWNISSLTAAEDMNKPSLSLKKCHCFGWTRLIIKKPRGKASWSGTLHPVYFVKMETTLWEFVFTWLIYCSQCIWCCKMFCLCSITVG